MALQIDPVHSAYATLIVTTKALSDGPARIEQARARWRLLSGLRNAALHASPASDGIVEYLQWTDPESMTAADAQSRGPYIGIAADDLWVAQSTQTLLTPGPDYAAPAFKLFADPALPTPTLVSLLVCEAARQQELTDYLAASAQRFRTLFGGWIGAVLHARDDGLGVTEYLQFETFDAMGALQERAELHAHKAHLETFGLFRATVVVPVATMDGAPVEGAAA
jgi:hypothetical protein